MGKVSVYVNGQKLAEGRADHEDPELLSAHAVMWADHKTGKDHKAVSCVCNGQGVWTCELETVQ